MVERVHIMSLAAHRMTQLTQGSKLGGLVWQVGAQEMQRELLQLVARLFVSRNAIDGLISTVLADLLIRVCKCKCCIRYAGNHFTHTHHTHTSQLHCKRTSAKICASR